MTRPSNPSRRRQNTFRTGWDRAMARAMDTVHALQRKGLLPPAAAAELLAVVREPAPVYAPREGVDGHDSASERVGQRVLRAFQLMLPLEAARIMLIVAAQKTPTLNPWDFLT